MKPTPTPRTPLGRHWHRRIPVCPACGQATREQLRHTEETHKPVVLLGQGAFKRAWFGR